MIGQDLIRAARRTSLAASAFTLDPQQLPSGAGDHGSGKTDAERETVRVAVRVRPRNGNEARLGSNCIVTMNPSRREVFVEGEGNGFPVDVPLWSILESPALDGSKALGQEDVYRQVGRPLLQHALQGYNATVLAYGQTGSGKTYTMMGLMNDRDEMHPETEGLIPRFCQELFTAINPHKEGAVATPNAGVRTPSAPSTPREGLPLPAFNRYVAPVGRPQLEQFIWEAKVQYVEIYCEKVTDLLSNNSTVTIREDQSGQSFSLVGASKVPVGTAGEVLKILRIGNGNRRTAATKMNDRSSRSHAVFIIELTETLKILQPDGVEATAHSKTVSIKLVDLAGSERVAESGVTGKNLKEAASINLSLFTLGQVIDTLTDPRKRGLKPPYRDSALTKILRNSFGGNSKTTMIATVGPTEPYRSQTIQTLQYATRARRIVNTPVVHEDPAAAELRKAQEELQLVKQQLEDARKSGVAAKELEQKLEQANERMRNDQLEAQREKELMEAREKELVDRLRHSEQLEAEFEQRMQSMEDEAQKMQEIQKAKELDLQKQREEMDSHIQEIEQKMASLTSAMTLKEKELKERQQHLEEELQKRQAEADAEAQRLEAESKQREAAILEKQATLEREAQAREAAMIARQTSLEAKAKEREAELAAKQEAAEADAAKREAEWRQRDAEMKTQQAAMEAEIARRETEAKNREAELLKRQAEADAEAQRLEAESKQREAAILEKQHQLEVEAKKREEELAARHERLLDELKANERSYQERAASVAQRQRNLEHAVESQTAEISRREAELKQREEDAALQMRMLEAMLASKQTDADERAAAQKKQLAEREAQLNAAVKENAEAAKLLAERNKALEEQRRLAEEQKTKHLQTENLLKGIQLQYAGEQQHRMAGKQSATSLTDDLLKRNEELMEEIRRMKARWVLLMEQKKVECSRCTWVNDMTEKKCACCSMDLN